MAVALVVLVLTTGCTASRLSQDATVTVAGTVDGPDGQPLSGATVVLVKEVDLGEVAFGFTAVLATLGTICLVDPPPAICSRARRATTAADGAYTFKLSGRDTQGSVGNASTFDLTAGTGDRGPSVSARFQVQRTNLAVPTLQLWAPKVDLSVNRTARGQWPRRDPSATERLAFHDAAGDIVWVADGPAPVSIDARILEDSQGTAVVESDATADSGGTTFRLTYQSAWVDYAGNAGPAPSRNAPCTPAPAPAPCAVTDGDLGPPTAAIPATQEVSVDLGRPRVPPFIAVRGCSQDCKVDTSVDGTTWTVVGSGTTAFFTVTPIVAPPVRFVRVRSTSDLSRLAEVSVW